MFSTNDKKGHVVRAFLILLSTFVLTMGLFCPDADAKNSPRSTADLVFIECPQPPSNPPEIGASMFRDAAANTVVLGWYQFDSPGGLPDKQGWTEHDVSTQIAAYFHVAGSAGGCDPVTPVNGSKSMWCGRWAATGDPWCNWATLPGYGSWWDQWLQSTVNATSVTYTIAWDTEPAEDYAFVEWYDSSHGYWDLDPDRNGGMGGYTGTGGPQTETSISPFGPTKVRFRFFSDGAWDDEDGRWDTAEGAIKVDDLSLDGGPVEDWEDEACGAQQSSDGKWIAAITPPFGLYAALHGGATVLQEDPCDQLRSSVWGFFDDPAVTNYACGGWPLQGAVPLGPDENGLYLDNEIWSPWIPIAGAGSEYILQFLVYRDLPLEKNVFYLARARTRDNGCPTRWSTAWSFRYGAQKDWYREEIEIGAYVPGGANEIQVSLGAVDFCKEYGGIWGPCSCHSHAPLFDQVRVLHVEAYGPLWTVRDIDLWQDNFPELGGISSTSYARCDMAQSTIPSNKKNILPGDSLKLTVTDPAGLADDYSAGRTDTKAVYVFVKVTDRFGNPIAGKNNVAIQSPDKKRGAGDATGLLRYPFVNALAPAGWDAYRLDLVKTAYGSAVKDAYCGDLMDLAAGPDGPPYHPNENQLQNTGIFTPGDVIHYFFGAKNTLGQWSYWHRTFDGQGSGRRTNAIAEAMASPCEWSVLPDAGRNPGYGGDILFVDDADDRGGPAQLYFDWAVTLMNIEDRVDRFDVLGPSSCVGNSLASRVKNLQTQIIGDPIEVYAWVLWNASDLSTGLMGDGGTPNGGSSAEKSDDFSLCYTFLNTHPGNPGWAYWGDDAAQDWAGLTGAGAASAKNIYMNQTLTSGNQSTLTDVVSPRVFPASPTPPAGYLQPVESFYLHGGCYGINDFDVPGQTGLSRVSHRYNDAASGPTAALSQITPNAASSSARFFLGGFGYNFIRDDDADGVPDYAKHLTEIFSWFQRSVDNPTGIDPLIYANRLDNAYPNPFNPTTTIRYSIASAGHVSLKIYNAAGQLVRTLVDEDQAPAAEGFSVAWDAKNSRGQNVASGVYFYRLAAKGYSDTKKIVLLR
jgi:hypothetical protein